MKEPLRGTWYNTRDELLRAIERSVRNINNDGRANGVQLANVAGKRKQLRSGHFLVLSLCERVIKGLRESC